MRLRGKGAPGLRSGPAGDAYVTMMVRTHPVLRREADVFALHDGGLDVGKFE